MKRKAGDGPVQALLLGVIEGITEFTAVTQTGGQRDEQRLTLGDGLFMAFFCRSRVDRCWLGRRGQPTPVRCRCW